MPTPHQEQVADAHAKRKRLGDAADCLGNAVKGLWEARRARNQEAYTFYRQAVAQWGRAVADAADDLPEPVYVPSEPKP